MKQINQFRNKYDLEKRQVSSIPLHDAVQSLPRAIQIFKPPALVILGNLFQGSSKKWIRIFSAQRKSSSVTVKI